MPSQIDWASQLDGKDVRETIEDNSFDGNLTDRPMLTHLTSSPSKARPGRVQPCPAPVSVNSNL